MNRRNFIVAWFYGLLYAIFPSLRPPFVLREGWWRHYAAWKMARPIYPFPDTALSISPEPLCFGPYREPVEPEPEIYVTVEQHGDPCICGCTNEPPLPTPGPGAKRLA